MDDRSTYIGGSDVARILGVSSYGGPVALWRKKVGLEPDETGPILRAGLHMEPFILREYEATGAVLRTGHVTADGREVWAQQTARHWRFTWAGATIDTFADRDGVRLIVDAKMSRKAVDAADPDSVPWDWSLQLHHYGWICGIDRAELAICRTGADFSVVAVPVDLDLDWYEAHIVPQLAEFWDCIVNRREPEPRPFVERDPPPDFPEWADLCRRYADAAEMVKAYEAIKDDAGEALKAAIMQAGRPKKATAGSYRISAWSVKGRESLDLKALRADMPDVASKYTKTGEASVQMRVTPKGEAA